ncbi:MAG: DUF1641 domain-containing protein [Bacillota bacterium]|nr:DUF1641 domain-containing protein [Bacillota bacterium]
MAKPISTIAIDEKTEDQIKLESIEGLVDFAADRSAGLKQTIELLHELHESGMIEILVSLVQAKEKVAKIALDQIVRPPVTAMINNGMAAAGALSELDPEFTTKLVKGLTKGMKEGSESLKKGEKAGILDLLKAIKDPDINRTILFGIKLLKGIGEGLK